MKKFAKEFRVSTAAQRSEQWYQERAGIPSASGLGFLFDTLKKDGVTLSVKAKEYRRQLAFERKFGVTYGKFDSAAMQQGRFYEDFAKRVYQKETGSQLEEAFSYISDWFVATPDAIVTEAVPIEGSPGVSRLYRGLLECKVLGDGSFMDVIENGLPLAHELQVQGQMMATGLDWVDYIAVNVKTKAYIIIRVERNNKLIKRIYERLHEDLELPELPDVKRFDEQMLDEYFKDNNKTTAAFDDIDLPF